MNGSFVCFLLEACRTDDPEFLKSRVLHVPSNESDIFGMIGMNQNNRKSLFDVESLFVTRAFHRPHYKQGQLENRELFLRSHQSWRKILGTLRVGKGFSKSES